MGGFSTVHGGNNVSLAASSDVPSGGVDPFFMDLMRRAMRKKLGKEQGGGAFGAAPRATRQAEIRQAAPERAAPRGDPNAGKIPMYIKHLSGFNMGGTVKAQPWEPGAAFAGYAPPGYSPHPNTADFVGDVNAPPAAGLSPGEPGRPAAPDPFPHGTGAAFENERFRAARARSDEEAAQRSALASLNHRG